MSPKPNGTSNWIKNSALIREIEHGSLGAFSVNTVGMNTVGMLAFGNELVNRSSNTITILGSGGA
jgi:hypothetical protein